MNEQCPRCGSYRTQKHTKLSRAGLMFAAAGGTSLAGILFFPALILVPFFLLAAVGSLFMKPEWECKECRNKWKVEKKENPKKKKKAEEKKEYSQLFHK